MRIPLIVIQLILSAAFAVLFVWSFFTEEYIRNESKSYISLKVIKIIDPQVAIAEELLNGPGVAKVLNNHQIEAIKAEVAHYIKSPSQYVLEVVDSKVTVPTLITEDMNLASKFLLNKIGSWKSRIASYFAKTFNRLIIDIRIFLASNMIALLIASLVIYGSESKARLTVSIILTFVIALSIWAYLSQSWFFNILLNNHMGIAYPVTLMFLWGWLLYDYGKERGWGRER